MWRRLDVNHVFAHPKPKLTSHKKKDPNHFRTVLLMISCFFLYCFCFENGWPNVRHLTTKTHNHVNPFQPQKKGPSTFLGFASSVVGKKLSTFPNGGEKWCFLPSYYCWWLKFQTTTWEYLRCIKPHYLIYRINWWTPDFSLNSRILKKSAKTSLRELTWIENSPLGKQTGRGLIALFFLLWGQLRKSRGISIYIYK